MPAIQDASLRPIEHQAVTGLVEAVRDRYGERFRAAWLHGSRARGEPPREDSDIDLIFLLDDPTYDDQKEVVSLAFDVGNALGYPATYLSPLVRETEWPAKRRAIRDFFIADVDHDRIVLYEA